MSEEEKKAIEYFEKKIKNKLPLYEETYVDGKLYRRNILQLETNFTEEQANKTETLLNLIEKQQKEIEEKSTIIMAGAEKVKQLEKEIEELRERNKKLVESIEEWVNGERINDIKFISKDKIREVISNKRKKVLEKPYSKLSIGKRIYKRNVQVAMLDTLLKELLEEK